MPPRCCSEDGICSRSTRTSPCGACSSGFARPHGPTARAGFPTSPAPLRPRSLQHVSRVGIPTDACDTALASCRPRGAFFEIARSHGGAGQSSFSTTRPGSHAAATTSTAARSSGSPCSRARPTSRCGGCFTDEVIEFRVTGDEPVAVDMPTMWAHNITNTGDRAAHTSFWIERDLRPGTTPTRIAEAVPDDARRLKVMTVVGTRPEIIRLSRGDRPARPHRRPRAGAHRPELRLRAQRHLLRGARTPRSPTTSSGSTRRRSARCSAACWSAIEGGASLEERPDALLVLGDTNSCIAALMARRMKVPVYHMEAGNRCFDLNVPEETNRRLVDHVADFNLVYTEHARRNLLAEGLHPRRILHTGSPMREVLEHYRGADRGSRRPATGSELDAGRLLPGQRPPRGERRRPGAARAAAGAACARSRDDGGLPVLVSTHPRTRKRLEQLAPDASLAGRAHLPRAVRLPRLRAPADAGAAARCPTAARSARSRRSSASRR